MSCAHVPSMRWRVSGVVLAVCAQVAFLVWGARAAVMQSLQCDVCDTSYYFAAAAEFARSGLLFANPYDGYRSYFVPFFVASVQRVASATGFAGSAVELYTGGVCVLFVLVSATLMTWLATRASVRTFIAAAGATLLNPFLVIYVPFALQEGVLMVCCLPLLFVWVGARDLPPFARAALVLAMALLAWVIRASLAWWLLPACLYAAVVLWPRVRQPRHAFRGLAALIVAGTLLVGPQIYISRHKFDSFNPYPSTALFSQQVNLGITLLKFATVRDAGHWRGLTHWSPFAAEPEDDKTARFYLEHPSRALFLMLSHAYAGFHYDQIRPYFALERARPLTIWLVLSSAVVYLGLVRLGALVLARRVDADRAFVGLTLALCAGSVLFVAAESRFGIVGFAMLSILVAEWLAGGTARSQWRLLAPGLLLYLALSFLFNAMLLQSADVRL